MNQGMMNDGSLLSNNVLVRELIDGGDVHHVFPISKMHLSSAICIQSCIQNVKRCFDALGGGIGVA